MQDLPVFERHVAQLKLYYADHGGDKPSEQKYPILGLYLLHLLASDIHQADEVMKISTLKPLFLNPTGK